MSKKTDLELVSIIIPVYNARKFLNDCLASAVQQTYKNTEIIIVDDGSTDGSWQLIKKAAEEHDNMQALRQKNSGPGPARNYGIDQASGEYILFLDADDMLVEDAVEKLVRLAMDNQADVVCAGYDRATGEAKSPQVRSYASRQALTAMLYMKIPNGIGAKLYKRSIVGRTRLPKLAVAEDLSFNFEVFRVAKKVTTTNEIVYFYRDNDASLTKKPFDKKRMDGLIAVKNIYKKAGELGTKVERAAGNRLFMEAYFILESIVGSGVKQKYKSLYDEARNIIKSRAKDVSEDNESSKKAKIIALGTMINPELLLWAITAVRKIKR